MFYFRSTTTGIVHPKTEDRLVFALNQLQLDKYSPCWGIALIGLDLWAKQFNLNLYWDRNSPDKEAFDKLINEIKTIG